MTDHFSISEPLKDLEQAALMPIGITESKKSMQASHYQFSISAALADLQKAALECTMQQNPKQVQASHYQFSISIQHF